MYGKLAYNKIKKYGNKPYMEGDSKMTNMVKEKLAKSEFWNNLHNLICNWHIALKTNDEEMSKIYLAQWEIAQSALTMITDTEWHFTRNDKHFGICTEDGRKFLIRYDI